MVQQLARHLRSAQMALTIWWPRPAAPATAPAAPARPGRAARTPDYAQQAIYLRNALVELGVDAERIQYGAHAENAGEDADLPRFTGLTLHVEWTAPYSPRPELSR
ncbi:MAG: hypothetical protein IT379_06235 [Deltaproteobacteria bacterium]|nr:hypothetical protein [Deltaproteobacteria bacterium]